MSETTDDEELLINEVKLLLAEKRTHLAILRTGAALFTLAITALGVLLVRADLSSAFTFDWSTVVVIVLLLIALLGGWQMYHSNMKVRRLNDLIEELEQKNKRIAEIVV